MRNKVKRRISIGKIILTIFGVLFILLVAFVIIMFNTDADVSNISISVSVSASSSDTDSSSDSSEVESIRTDLEGELVWFDSIEAAIKDTSLIKESYDFEYAYERSITNEIMRVESDNQLTLFYRPQNEIYGGAFITFYIENGKISQPYIISIFEFGKELENDHYKYDLDDSISNDIVFGYIFGKYVENAEGSRMYFGTWMHEREIKSLTIDGNEPDKIIPIQVGENTHYFWCYSKTDLDERLEKLDYSDFTRQQVTDSLKVRYQKQEEK